MGVVFNNMTSNFHSRWDEAVKLKQAKKLDLAWEAFTALAEENPHSAFFWSNYAHLALMKNRIQQARQFAEHALSIDSHNRFCRSLYADILLQSGDSDYALALIRKLMEEKLDVILIKKLVKECEHQKRLKEVETDFQECLHRYSDDDELLAVAVEYYHKIGKTNEAIEYYQKIINQGKATDFIYERLIALKTHGKSSAEKIKQLEVLLKMPSQKKNIHLLGLLAQEYKKISNGMKPKKSIVKSSN